MKNRFYILLFSSLFSVQTFAQTWNVVPSGTTKNLNSISFPSTAVGYIAGDDSLLLKTIDGGLTWNELDMTNFTFSTNVDDFNNVEFVSNTVGYLMVGPYGGTYKTIDGGITWTNVGTMCFNTSMYMFDENNGFQGGAGCFSGENITIQSNGIWDTTNINQFYYATYGSIGGFDFWDDSIGLAASSSNYFFKTIDGGFTWDTIHSSLGNSDELTSVLFIDSLNVVATFIPDVSGGSGIILSSDGGLTWTVHLNGGVFVYPNLFTSKKSVDSHIYLGGQIANDQIGVIYESNNAMTSWSNTFVQEGINDFASRTDTIVFAVGKNGYIIVNKPLGGLSLDEQSFSESFIVYPNPSIGEFQIKNIDLSISEIQIYDVKGSRIDVETITQKTPNDWLVSGLDSGIYVIKVRLENRWYSRKITIF